MTRNKNIDILRAVSILLIIIYHCYATTGTGGQLTQWFHLNHFIGYGGEIGVTLFFMLSGLGIAYSLYYRMESNEAYTYKQFIRKRIRRIVPQYYLCIFFLVLFAEGAKFLSKSGLKSVVSHMLFVHNFSLDTSGSINGALWTLGASVQFYLIAYPLYYLIKKKPILCAAGSVLITILSKILIFHYFAEKQIFDGWYYFLHGRQVLTAFDNFVLGMVIGYLLASGKKSCIRHEWIRWIVIAVDVILVDVLIHVSNHGNRWANTKTGWFWYSALAVVLAHFVWNFANCRLKGSNKVLLWIAKYEYGIYLWHLPMITNLYELSPLAQTVKESSMILFTIIIILISCYVGYVSTLAVAGIEKGK